MKQIVEVLINHFLNYEFVYIFLFCSLISLIFAMFIQRKILKIIGIILFSIFFVLSSIEFLLSLYMPISQLEFHKHYLKKIHNYNTVSRREIELVDNQKGISFCNTLINENFLKQHNYRIIFDVNYTTFENGFRYTECNVKSKTAYVFLGCSFVLGLGVKDNETLPYYFSKISGFNNNILNCGCPGLSTTAATNILENDIIDTFIKNSQIKHFFYSFIPDHIDRNFRIESNSMCIDSCKYQNNRWIRVQQPFGMFKVFFARSYIFRKVFLVIIDEYNKQFYEDYMISNLMEINKIIEEKYKSKFTVVAWPGAEEKFIENLKANLDVIMLSEYFNPREEKYIIPIDGHPSAEANKTIAQILYNHIQNN